MKRPIGAGRGAAILFAFLIASLAGCTAFAEQPSQTSTQADQKCVSITLYNSGSALIRDTRRLELPQGTVELKFLDVARRLLPDSVTVSSLTAPSQLHVIQQTYTYGLLSPFQLLQAYVGKTLTVVLMRRKNGSDLEEPLQATLLAANAGPVWRIAGKIQTNLRVDHYIFPEIPPNLSAKPSLILLVQNAGLGEQELRVSYLTNGLDWNANYTLDVSRDWRTAELSARALINNQSGTDYRNSELQLVAGEVHRVNEGITYGIGGAPGGFEPRARMLMQAQPVVQQPFSGYHIYTFSEPTDLPNSATKQLILFRVEGVKITRNYVVNGQVYYNEGAESDATRRPVELSVKFHNDKTNSLGEPLPGGIARVYQADETGSQQLVGEDRLNPTAQDETATLNLGNAFDVVEEEKQTEYHKIGPNAAESSYEVTLRNHESQPVVVSVNEPFNGDWQILGSSLPYEKTSSTSARFQVPVPANGVAVLKYRVRVQWVRPQA